MCLSFEHHYWPSFASAICLVQLRPIIRLYFEERSSGLFETRSAGQSITIRADRIELDGVTLRFVHPSKKRAPRRAGYACAQHLHHARPDAQLPAISRSPNPPSLSRNRRERFMVIQDIWNTIWISRQGRSSDRIRIEVEWRARHPAGRTGQPDRGNSIG